MTSAPARKLLTRTGSGIQKLSLVGEPTNSKDRSRRVAAAIEQLLIALGQDPRSGDLIGTPERLAHVFGELLDPTPFSPETFTNDLEYEELVMVYGIKFQTLCTHHLLPLRGVAHVGYLPDERMIGLSQLARLVESTARNLQLLEKLTTQIAYWLVNNLAPRGVGVVLETEHVCMNLLGAQAEGSRTVTSSFHGLLSESLAARNEFLRFVQIDA